MFGDFDKKPEGFLGRLWYTIKMIVFIICCVIAAAIMVCFGTLLVVLMPLDLPIWIASGKKPFSDTFKVMFENTGPSPLESDHDGVPDQDLESDLMEVTTDDR